LVSIISFLLLLEIIFVASINVIIPNVTGWPDEKALYPIQVFEAHAVYNIHKALGYPVELKNELELHYYSPEFRNGTLSMSIYTPCAGIHELVFLTGLILGVRSRGWKSKLKWLCILNTFLFLENLLRILLLYPLARWVGEDTMWYYHYIFWQYGHLIIILLIFSFWYVFIMRKRF
jgi:exosortase/archaeosortase family protein